RHFVTVPHPPRDSIGVRALRTMVWVTSDSTTTVLLGGPTLATLKGKACADTAGLLTGVIRDAATRIPIDSARVILSWVDILVESGRVKSFETKEASVYSNARRRYGPCVAPRTEPTLRSAPGGATI